MELPRGGNGFAPREGRRDAFRGRPDELLKDNDRQRGSRHGLDGPVGLSNVGERRRSATDAFLQSRRDRAAFMAGSLPPEGHCEANPVGKIDARPAQWLRQRAEIEIARCALTKPGRMATLPRSWTEPSHFRPTAAIRSPSRVIAPPRIGSPASGKT